MCGIAGYWRKNGAADPALIDRMNSRIAHRGPDASGVHHDGGVALGHQRLSIIDVSGGSQPLSNEDGSLHIVFNGEIYNYQPLRRDLLQRGHRFTTGSDTEVLVHLYEEVGQRLPQYLNGMFALALWDARRQELFLCRDRLGKKPLYYTADVPGFAVAFASELKALCELPGWRGEVRPASVADFLALSYVPDPYTIYEGVYKLPPGHHLTVTRRGAGLAQRYWQPVFQPHAQASFMDAVEEVRSLAQDAVSIRLMSDVPLGAFLSGGVDSGAVVGLMAQAAPERVRTFSIGFTDRNFDELEFARLSAARHATEHHERIVTPDVQESLQELAWHFDEPFGDSSAIPSLALARMTREHVTVALSGDGADEVFGGYRRYRWGVIEERLRRRFPDWFRTGVIGIAGRHYPKFDYLPQVFRAKTLLTNVARTLGDAYFTSLSTFRDEGLQAVLSPDLAAALAGYSPRAAYQQRFEQVRELTPLQQMQAVDFDTYLPGDILVKADRATMAHSLEGRAPWMDYRLVELACRLPSWFLLSGKTGKFVFRRAVSDLLPTPVLTRRKQGFSVPLAAWFRTSLRETFRHVVLQPDMERYIHLSEAERLWAEHQSGYHNHDRKLWNLLMLASWDLRHGAGARQERLAELIAR